MIQTRNTRKTDKVVEDEIRTYWRENQRPRMFDGDRARFEGFHYDEKSHELKIFYSHEKYRSYFCLGDKNLPRSRQALLLSINGVLVTRDNLIPVGFRGAETNQEGIWHIVPAGYIDISPVIGKAVRKGMSGFPETWLSETPYTATERELHEELSLPKESVNVSRMRLLGIVFNSNRDFDTTICVVVPVDCHSSEITLKGDEHVTMRFLKTSLNDLKEELIRQSRDLSTSSGHLRGDIALTIAHLYGQSEYMKTIESVSREISTASY